MADKVCGICMNAFLDRELDPEYDSSSVCLDSVNGVSVLITSGSLYSPPVFIEIMQWNEKHQQNFTLMKIPLRYCPFCGRKIEENTPYLK
mgnify:CR=1 FL=1